MRYIVVDLEATCWERTEHDDGAMEIIEIGAVEFESASGVVSREFSAFVRPVQHPKLSKFCSALTHIRQRDVDSARIFPKTLAMSLDWIGSGGFTFGSWGQYDLNQFRKDCTRHKIQMPTALERHVNIKYLFCDRFGIRRTKATVMGALRHLGLRFEGTHHRGVDDARNIAKIARILLPYSMHVTGPL